MDLRLAVKNTVLTILTAASALWYAAPAQAQLDPGATALFVSEPGDYIGQGQTLYFDRVYSSFNGLPTLYMAVESQGHSYTLVLNPGYGRDLAPGVYENAKSNPWGPEDPTPRLQFFGDSRGCTSTGRFEIRRYDWSTTTGRFDAFDLSFETRCENETAALRGEIRVGLPPLDRPPPPPPLTAVVEVDSIAYLSPGSGIVTIGGTVTCSRYANTEVILTGSASQNVPGRTLGFAGFTIYDYCSTEPHNFTYQFVSEGIPFHLGRADIHLVAEVPDPDTGSQTTSVVDQPVAISAIGK